MSSAFNYDDALGEFSIPSGLGYEDEAASGLQAGSNGADGTSPGAQGSQAPKERKKILLMGMKRR